MLYRALIKTHHMTSRKKLAAIHALTRKHACVVYLKKGLRPPAVLVAEKYWRVDEMEQLGEKEMDDGDGQTGEKVLRDWVKGVKVRGRWYFRFVLHREFGVGILNWVV